MNDITTTSRITSITITSVYSFLYRALGICFNLILILRNLKSLLNLLN